jgi:polyadenylate-binding protein
MVKQVKPFTNLWVKNLPESMNEQKLQELFQVYGKIASYKLIRHETGRSLGFGFVAFEDCKAAENAITQLNEKEIDGKILYLGHSTSNNGT